MKARAHTTRRLTSAAPNRCRRQPVPPEQVRELRVEDAQALSCVECLSCACPPRAARFEHSSPLVT